MDHVKFQLSLLALFETFSEQSFLQIDAGYVSIVDLRERYSFYTRAGHQAENPRLLMERYPSNIEQSGKILDLGLKPFLSLLRV